MNLTNTQKQLHVDLLQKNYFFDIELTANCNLNCTFCPREFIERENTKMHADVMNMLPNWLPQKCNVMFAGMGEPILSEHLFEIINCIANGQRIIGITTNGQLLNKNIIDRLFESNLNFLQISVNELNNNKYEVISGEKGNKKVLDSIKKIVDRNTNNKIQIQFSFVANDITEVELVQQQNFSIENNSSHFSKMIHNRGGFLNQVGETTYTQCYLFSQVTYINSDGNILYCCHDLPAKSVIGNVKTHSFKEIIDKKSTIIEHNNWLQQCSLCNDTGREAVIR